MRADAGQKDEAKRALFSSNCAKAVPAAQASIGWLSERPQPYEILGLCDAERGLDARAVGRRPARAAIRGSPTIREVGRR